jgi:hypothetical protein
LCAIVVPYWVWTGMKSPLRFCFAASQPSRPSPDRVVGSFVDAYLHDARLAFVAHRRPLDFPKRGLALGHILRLREAGGENQREKKRHCLTR